MANCCIVVQINFDVIKLLLTTKDDFSLKIKNTTSYGEWVGTASLPYSSSVTDHKFLSREI